jgi:uridine kinase
MQECCRLIAIAGMGGIGNTMLVTQLAQQLAEQFEIVVWRSLRHAP